MALKYDDKYVKIHSIYKAMLMENQDNVNWRALSGNPAAIELLTANQDKILWAALSSVPTAIKLLNANQDKINWSGFCATPFLEYDFERIAKERGELNQAIIAAVHHPSRIQKWLDDGNEISNYMS